MELDINIEHLKKLKFTFSFFSSLLRSNVHQKYDTT